ncbi:MAG TPA: hypothetical protein DEA82_14060 [Flavobacteriaceae bacterium]|nr:hypothetical protein [Flavobacteriaceae bacterium]
MKRDSSAQGGCSLQAALESQKNKLLHTAPKKKRAPTVVCGIHPPKANVPFKLRLKAKKIEASPP